MSYDAMRLELVGKLSEQFPAEIVGKIVNTFDVVAQGYTIGRQETALIVSNSIPEIVKAYIAAKAVENLARGSLNNYFLALKHFFSTVRKPLEDINANDIRAYLYTYKKERNIKDSTLEGKRIIIHSFFAWCVDEEYLAKNPARKVAPIKVQQPNRHGMTPLELERFRALCQTKREKATVDFLFSTGCRVQELCNVKKSDIDWNEKTVSIINGKGGKNRITYLNPEAIISLSDYINSRNDDCEYLFTMSRKKKQLTKKSVERSIQQIAGRSTKEFSTHITPHVFRHTAATVALRNGMPIEQVQKFLGHSKISTTLIYASTDDSMVRMNHQKCVC